MTFPALILPSKRPSIWMSPSVTMSPVITISRPRIEGAATDCARGADEDDGVFAVDGVPDGLLVLLNL